MNSEKAVAEIETKLHIPDNIYEKEFLRGLEELILNEKWVIVARKKDKRKLTYYDTPELEMHKQRATIRVSEYDPSKNPGRFRYDFKTGSIEERKEAKYWTERLLEPPEIITMLGLNVKALRPIVNVTGYPILMDIEKQGTILEVKFDTCKIGWGLSFRELELELKEGNASEIEILVDKIQSKFKLERGYEQKYSRVVRMLGITPESLKRKDDVQGYLLLHSIW